MKYFLVIIFVFTGYILQAQQTRFVFFQAPQGKPFYVRLGADNYSSSAFGHLVIPRLKDSIYHFFIGFPRNEIPEREFLIDLKERARGYDIRIENQTEVNLFEWQTGKLISPSGKEDPGMMAMKGKKRSDPYALLMAGVVNDPLVLYMQEPVKEEVAKSTVSTPEADTQALAAIDMKKEVTDSLSREQEEKSQTATVATPATETGKEDPPVSPVAGSETGAQVVRLFEETVAEGKRMLYIDNSESTRDSIDILIVKEMPESNPLNSSQAEGKEDKEEDSGSSIVLSNSNCTRSATEQDIDRLRVLMLKQKSDDDKVFSARKLLKSRCMTAAQVRALSELFPSDEGRYMFFDAAYPFVSDSGNFKELINLLTDPYYINRFKAMVRM